jgi:serine/threonine-protein kinase
MPVSDAEQLLDGQGFKIKVAGEEPDPEVPAGAVLRQEPPPDLVVPRGTTIELVRSSGPAIVPVPDVADFDIESAIRVVVAAGLKLGEIDTVPGGSERDIVVGTRPEAGAAKTPGSTIDLLVSEGPSGIAVPNVVGLRQEDARKQLESAGFRVGRVTRTEARRGPPNTVVEQQPAAGVRSSRRTRIDLLVTEVN